MAPDGERVPVPALVVLVGASGSGKSTWAASTFGGASVVSSDALRALVGEGEQDQAASADAFGLLERAVAARLARGLTTVVDTTGLSAEDRERWRAAGRAAGLPCAVVVFDVPAAACRARNRSRERRVPDRVVDDQSRRLRAQRAAIDDGGWDLVLVVDDDARPAGTVTAALAASAPAAAAQRDDPRPLRFGLHVSRFDLDGGPAALGERLAAVARTAEEVGFASLWVMDHAVQIPQVGRWWDPILEPFTTLTHLAASTRSVTVGPLVAGITHRNVALLGKTVASLDVLSGGRAVCGLGAAWFEREHVAHGHRFPPAVERLDLLEDALGLLPVLWGPGTPAFRGRRISVPEAVCYPRPLRGTVPILVGGQGPRRTLRLAARHADACNLFGEPDAVASSLAVLHRHCDEAGRDRAEVAVTHLSTSLVGRDAAEVDALVSAHGPARGRERWRASVHAGTVEDQVGRFRALLDVGVQEAVVALEDLRDERAVERFAPVVDAFA